MSSSLSSKLQAFRKEQADTAARNIQHSRPTNSSSTPARVSTPQPSSDSSKRNHDTAFSNQLAPGGAAGHELVTQVAYVVAHLKSKSPQPLSFNEIIRHLSLPVDAEHNKPLIRRVLEDNDRVELVRKGTNGSKEDSFKYRPKHPVTNAEELKDYLARQPSASGISIKELKDGWSDCVKAVDQLEKEHAVLVSRNKKDNTPKTVWPDSAAYYLQVDPDFRDFWIKTKLPATENDIRTELEKAGITPTSQVKEAKKIDMRKRERKRPNRRGGKTTNSHMTGILKEYSSRK